MPRFLALEWDAHEARVAVARPRAGGLAVEQAFAVALPQREGSPASEAEIGAAVAKALADHGLARAETLVAVGRSNIELRFLNTPPVPPEELPDVVRFQALRQFTTLGDDWPLDFVPLSQTADGGNNVLAAAIAPELVQQIRATTAAAGLTLTRLVLRPFAAASLVRQETADGKCRMMVDLLKDDADLTVLIGQQVIFPRTVRLPAAEPEILAKALLAEGRRTIIAAQNQLGGRRVEEVIIFGDGRHHGALKQLLEQELSLPVKLIDPFDRVHWENPQRAAKPEFPATFAPLLGVLMDEASQAPHAIDFLHPRQKPPPPNRRRTIYAVGASVAAVALIIGFLLLSQIWALDARIKQLKLDKAAQEKIVKQGVKPRNQLEKLDQFAAADVNWLEELRNLSEKFPAPEATLVEELHAAHLAKEGGGKVVLAGFADEPASITKIEQQLRDEQHGVHGTGGKYDAEAEKLQWKFKEEVSIGPTDPEAPLPVVKQPEPPAEKTPTAAASGTKGASKSSSSRKGGRP